MAKRKNEKENKNKNIETDVLNEKIEKIVKKKRTKTGIPSTLSILPLRDIVIFPNMIFPVLIGRSSSLSAIGEAQDRDKFIFVSAQKDPTKEEIEIEDLYEYGTVAKILQIIRLPNNLLKVLLEGFFQAKIEKEVSSSPFFEAKIKIIHQEYDESDTKLKAIIRRSSELFSEYIKSDKNLPPEIISAFNSIENSSQKLYYAAANIRTKISNKQKVLEQLDIYQQFFELNKLLVSEIELVKLENEIDTKIHDSMQKNQRKYYIQEQIRMLQNELNEDNEETNPDIAKIMEMFSKSELPAEVAQKVEDEIERLRKTPQSSSDYAVNRNYLETLASLPWSNKTTDNFDILNVKKILDEDHYDLEKPKERILEYIAVLNLSGILKKQILCFVGPPGVGKTSLAKSIARALGRNFVRFSLGGVRDEAEIRGHRRTYVGSMPGRIIQSMKKAGSVNPVILLDEIDKMSTDFRGDPSSALLEVLDPEQNIAFNDHYIEVDYDLSNVMFVTTANVRHEIPLPLQDRMEIIELSSYLENDKINIAKKHIIPKLLTEFGMEKLKITISDEAIQKIIREYTRESGVRNLERELASVLRKLAKEIVTEYSAKYSISQAQEVLSESASASESTFSESEFSTNNTSEQKTLLSNPEFLKRIKRKKYLIDVKKINTYLKAPKFKDKKELLVDRIGVVTGLAWTSVGGEILPVEATIMSGSEKLTLTGKLGEVMKESAAAALSFIRSNFDKLEVPEGFYSKKEIHIHVPEGAIPKDGPSAGITMTIALISAATGKKVSGSLAMTGEINLRGEVLAIGGLKEKLLAAKRIGISKVLVPADNTPDLEDLSDEIKKDIIIVPVKNIFEALTHCWTSK